LRDLWRARQIQTTAQREALTRIKAVNAAELALGVDGSAREITGSAKSAKPKAALTTATCLLESTRILDMHASRKLAKVLNSEAARVDANAQTGTPALFQVKPESESEADLQSHCRVHIVMEKWRTRMFARVARTAAA